MNDTTPETTPRFRLIVTAVGLAGLLTIAALTDTLGAVVAGRAALVGFGLTAVVSAFAWRYPDEFVSTPRAEAVAFAVVWAAGVLFGLGAPEALAAMIWTLVWTAVGLGALLLGRPKAVARLAACVEHAELER